MNENIINKIQTCHMSGDSTIAVQEYDVLLGRGKLYEKHLGNQQFQGAFPLC